MQTRIDEIAADIYRLSTFFPDIGGPKGFTFNQFLIVADEPLLFHSGQKPIFLAMKEAVARVIDPAKLRWISHSHTEADECGSLNDWLALAPQATAMHGALGCNFWLNDWAIRKPRKLANDEVIDLGGKRVRYLDTPHVPHDLAAGLLFEETTQTLCCSDLFAHGGNDAPLTSGDVVAPALAAEAGFPFTPVTAKTAPTLRRLAALKPRTLGIMHGQSFSGDAAVPLEALAQHYEAKLASA